MGWDNEYLHYSNSDNPFGDGNLLSTFVWNKKLVKEGITNVRPEELEVRNRYKQEENKKELEKVCIMLSVFVEQFSTISHIHWHVDILFDAHCSTKIFFGSIAN